MLLSGLCAGTGALRPIGDKVHDSLAEALLASGKCEYARAGHAGVLELDPGDRHAYETLEKLQRVRP